MKTAQQIADKVAFHLLTQKRKSGNESGGEVKICGLPVNYCLYRDAVGNKCAIGCLIPDGKYDDGMEYMGLQKSGISEALRGEGVDVDGDENVRNLLLKFQQLHDHQDVSDWPRAIRSIYDSHKLKVPDAVHLYANLDPEIDWTTVGVNITKPAIEELHW